MNDNPNPVPDPDARPGHDDRDKGQYRGHRADGGRDPAGSQPGYPTEDIRQLSPGEERDLHLNGFSRYGLLPLHELCPVGGCQFKTLKENIADLDWLIGQDRQPGRDDPEAGL
jgi:hypothetical protein